MKGIRIASKIDGFRRAGLSHSSTSKDYSLDELTPAQVKALRAEPNLTVVDINLPEPKPGKQEGGDGKPGGDGGDKK